LTIRRARTQRLAVQAVLAALIGLEVTAMSVSSTDLFVRRAASDIHLIAPRLHFLTGKTLERLRDGAVVPFDFQFTIAAGSKSNVVARAVERFTVSYDVWQEKFSVVRVSDFRKSSLSLSATAAEAWCVDNIFLPSSTLPAGKELWARLEIRSAEQRGPIAMTADSGISIVTLVELFSRPPRPQQDHWSLETAAFHLTDLKPELKP
jgi:hypothetical protein